LQSHFQSNSVGDFPTYSPQRWGVQLQSRSAFLPDISCLSCSTEMAASLIRQSSGGGPYLQVARQRARQAIKDGAVQRPFSISLPPRKAV
jgi:hypothetical protein